MSKFSPVFLGLILAIATSLSHAAAPPPNILLIVADDLGYGDLACFGHEEIRTPHLDRLAAEGMRLTHCYSSSAVCSPARAGLMTGRTPHRTGVYTHIPFMSPMHLPAGEVTVATLLKGAGYATAHIGKWHLNGQFNLPTQPQPADHGFDYSFGVQNNALPNHHNPYNFVRNGIPCGPIEGYSGPIVAGEAVAWLTQQRPRDKPFFMYVCFNEPHEPIATDPRFAAIYAAKHPDDPSRVAYYGNVTQMDDSIGRILAALDEQGLRDNTLVWFTSDNGPARTRWHNAGSAGGLRDFKGHLHEGGIRVPGIVRWPGHVAPGSISDEPVIGYDFLPTACDLAGIAPPRDRTIDGTSILPILTGGELAEPPRPLYWQFIWSWSEPQVAMRIGDWKILASLDGPRPDSPVNITENNMALVKHATLKDYQLYNLADDPKETTDLAAAESRKLAELRERLEAMHRSVKSDSPTWPPYTDVRYESQRIIWPDYVAKPLPGGNPKRLVR